MLTKERRLCFEKNVFTQVLLIRFIALDKGDHTLTDKQWMKKQRWIFALKLFWVIVLVATFLLAINVSVSYFVYFFYFVSILFILTKVLEYFIDRRVAQLAEEE